MVIDARLKPNYVYVKQRFVYEVGDIVSVEGYRMQGYVLRWTEQTLFGCSFAFCHSAYT
jgi:hypothetical protein